MAKFTVENVTSIQIFDTLLDAEKHKNDLTKCTALQPRAAEIYDEITNAGTVVTITECFEKALTELKNVRMDIYANHTEEALTININHLSFETRKMLNDFASVSDETTLPFTILSQNVDGIDISLKSKNIGKYKQNELKNCVTVAQFFNKNVIHFDYKDGLSEILRLY